MSLRADVSTVKNTRAHARPQQGLARCPVQRVLASASSSGSPQPPLSTAAERLQQNVNNALQKVGALALASLIAASPVAAEEGIVLRLPASDNPEVYTTQQTMFEAWSIVGDSFVDDRFNGHYWPDELKAHMIAAYNSKDGSTAYREIETMLADLGDPYTRIIPPSEYADFRVSSDGELQGVGLLIANEPYNNHLLVLSAIKGGPADRAGITSGDEVISINDQPTEGWTGDMAAKLLRGQGGTEVRVKFARRTSGIPGVPGRPEPAFRTGQLDEDATVKEVRLRREKLALSPVFYTALQAPDVGASGALGGMTLASTLSTAPPASSSGFAGGPLTSTSSLTSAGGVGMPASPDRLGYLRLASFTQNAAQDMKKAIAALEHKGVSGYILDLRDNPGGLVESGIDIARLLLDGHPTVFAITGRHGEPVQQVNLGDELSGPAEAITHRPLVVLVNEHSASASEILSGALHDNNRAVIVGDHNTFGKGRIQSVYELRDGSALFVTVARYVTPKGTEIDMKGIRPDSSCGLGSPMLGDGPDGMAGIEDNGSLAALLPGLPLGVAGEQSLVSALGRDRCVMTAMNMLRDRTKMIQATANVVAHLPTRL